MANALSSTVRETQNRDAAINKLPPEVLGRILRYSMGPFICFWSVDYHSGHMFHLHSVGQVCRHWRKVYLLFPELWQQIDIISQADLSSDYITQRIGQSGGSPLSVYIRPYLGESDSWNLPALNRILSQSFRIRDFHLHHLHGASMAALAGCDGSQLETLMIVAPDAASVPLFHSWSKTPRLRSLMVSGYTGWRCGVFEALQHLVLHQQHFTLDGFRKLLDILAASRGLEDLIIEHAHLSYTNEAEVRSAARQWPLVHMPRLKRLRVSSYQKSGPFDGRDSRKLAEMLSSHIIPPIDCPQRFAFSGRAPLPYLKSLHHPCSSQAQKLYLSNTDLMGVGEQSACYVTGGSLHRFLAHFVSISHIKELYIQIDLPRASILGHWLSAIQQMRNVKKLVLVSYIGRWLDAMSSSADFFPNLLELHLRTHKHSDGRSILRFLASRNREGRRIQELRITRGFSDDEVYYIWQARPRNFTKYVDNVIFVEYALSSLPKCLGLPPICKTESPVHRFWDPWQYCSRVPMRTFPSEYM